MRPFALWAPVVAYMAAIFFASSLHTVPGPIGSVFSDTVLHMGCYAGLAALSLRALARGRWAGVTMRVLAGAWLIATLYGAGDEIHQMYVPGRNSEFRDLINDAAGALAAVSIAGAWGIMRGPPRGSP